MSKAISIHVGVNQVTSQVFTAPPLERCEADATSMFDLAKQAGFEPNWKSPSTGKPSLLLGPDATYDNVFKAVTDAAVALDADGIFLFTFAGHGTSRFLDAGIGEPNGPNETIVLADHMLFDEVWRNQLWPSFKPGVRAVMIADCCKAGGVFTHLDFMSLVLAKVKSLVNDLTTAIGFRAFDSSPASANLVRRVNEEECRKELNANRAFYEAQTAPPAVPNPITIRRILLSACVADEDALEGPNHGVFTQALLDVLQLANLPAELNLNASPNRYDDLIGVVRNLVALRGFTQQPNLKFDGPEPSFVGDRPFSLS